MSLFVGKKDCPMFSFLKPKHKKNTKPIFFRRTIKYPGTVEGVGLHSGENMLLRFHPAEVGTGVLFFRRTPDGEEQFLSADLEHVVDTSWAVTLGSRAHNFHMQTVEHLMYAVHVLGITDILIEVEGHYEVPILDGSAKGFIEVLQQCEFHEYEEELLPIVIEKPLLVSDGNRYLVGIPTEKNTLEISYSVDYPHPLLKELSWQIKFDKKFFLETVGKARTIGFVREVEALKKRGLAQGGNTENVLVFDENDTVNAPRFTNEALYHKTLDLIGDLSLMGRPIIGHILAAKAGHSLDVAFGKKLLQQEADAKSATLSEVENLSEDFLVSEVSYAG